MSTSMNMNTRMLSIMRHEHEHEHAHNHEHEHDHDHHHDHDWAGDGWGWGGEWGGEWGGNNPVVVEPSVNNTEVVPLAPNNSYGNGPPVQLNVYPTPVGESNSNSNSAPEIRRRLVRVKSEISFQHRG